MSNSTDFPANMHSARHTVIENGHRRQSEGKGVKSSISFYKIACYENILKCVGHPAYVSNMTKMQISREFRELCQSLSRSHSKFYAI